MYLKLSLSHTFDISGKYYNVGLNILDKKKTSILDAIKSCKKEEFFDGDILQSIAFQSIKADVFISFSRDNEYKAICLLGFLESRLGLTCFVDYGIWDSCYNLIDDMYNEVELKREFERPRIKYISSHMYLMMCSAITEIISKSKCYIYINTDDTNYTSSPWLKYELSQVKFLTKELEEEITNKEQKVHNNVYKDTTKKIEPHNNRSKDIVINYKKDLNGFKELTSQNLETALNIKNKCHIGGIKCMEEAIYDQRKDNTIN